MLEWKIYKIKNIMYKNESACVVLINPDGLVLGVSRKDNHEDFGLIGGKRDSCDESILDTAIRECREETGLNITDLKLLFAIHKGGNMGFTYLANYSGEINHDEEHIVKWVPFHTLVKGSFGRYNQLVAESLDDMGVEYIYESYENNIN
jgi:8-oxo-dGTP pyrophosphatase MutT (NUDIX family)